MSSGVVHTCPLGSVCEEIKDNKLHRCMWYKQVRGKTPDGQETDKWDCAISWNLFATLEAAGSNRGQTAALESFRNEYTKAQTEFNNIALAAVNMKQLEKK